MRLCRFPCVQGRRGEIFSSTGAAVWQNFNVSQKAPQNPHTHSQCSMLMGITFCIDFTMSFECPFPGFHQLRRFSASLWTIIGPYLIIDCWNQAQLMNSNSIVPHFSLTCDRFRGFDGEIGTSCRPAVTSTRPTAVSASLTGPARPTGFWCSNRRNSTIPAPMNAR